MYLERVTSFFKTKGLRNIIRLLFFILFSYTIYCGFTGSLYRNFATTSSGILWLIAISIFSVLFGKLWCFVCPWDFFSDLISSSLFFYRPETMSFGNKYPRKISNSIFPILLFILIVWLEYTFAITDNPILVAQIAILLILTASLSSLVYDKKSFCRFICPVGAISGIYATLAPFGIRSKDKSICKVCKSKECIKGNDSNSGCPVFEYPGGMNSNLHCILCMECLKACPYNNIGVKLSSPIVTLAKTPGPILSEAILINLLLSFTVFAEIIHNTLIFDKIYNMLAIPGLSVLIFLAFLSIFFLLLYSFFVYIAIRLSRKDKVDKGKPFNLYFREFSLGVVPLALFIHLANIWRYFCETSTQILPALTDPLGNASNYLNIKFSQPTNLFNINSTHIIMLVLIIIGFMISIKFNKIYLKSPRVILTMAFFNIIILAISSLLIFI